MSSPLPLGKKQIVLRPWVRGLVRPVAGRPALLVELFIFWMFLQYFNFAQEHVRGAKAESMRHAHELYDLEVKLHINMEHTLNDWIAPSRVLGHIAGYYYGMVLATVPIALAWVWWKNPDDFRRLRRSLVAVTLPSLLVFWLLPVAPPRFALPGTIIDVDAFYKILGGALSKDPSRSANLYAAMPSLHIAWSSWVGYAIFVTLRRTRPRLAWFAWLYPILTAIDVMGTGNHFFLDVVGGAALCFAGVAVVRLFMTAEDLVWDEPGIEGDHHVSGEHFSQT